MRKSHPPQHIKVFYRPIEASIRWSGLVKFEPKILNILGNRILPDKQDFTRWPLLKLNLERLYDAIRNGELPYGQSGITVDDPTLLTQPDLTIRHVDLKSWMAHYYPDQKPDFLFEGFEQHLSATMSLSHVQVLLADREALRLQLSQLEQSLKSLHQEHHLLCQKTALHKNSTKALSTRGESTYLSIVGGLLTLLQGKSPAGKPYSTFATTDAIISTLLAYYPGQPGISERTLWQKFAEAKRHLNMDAE